MIQATTPTFVLTLPNDVDLTEASEILFSLCMGNVQLIKHAADMTVTQHTVSVYLTQAETLQFARGTAMLQLNWTYGDGSRACTNIVNVDVGANLYKEVI